MSGINSKTFWHMLVYVCSKSQAFNVFFFMFSLRIMYFSEENASIMLSNGIHFNNFLFKSKDWYFNNLFYITFMCSFFYCYFIFKVNIVELRKFIHSKNVYWLRISNFHSRLFLWLEDTSLTYYKLKWATLKWLILSLILFASNDVRNGDINQYWQ